MRVDRYTKPFFQWFSFHLITALCSQSLACQWIFNSSLYIVGKAVKDTGGIQILLEVKFCVLQKGQLNWSWVECSVLAFQGLGATENEAASVFTLCALPWFLSRCLLEIAVTKTVMLGRCKSPVSLQLMALCRCLWEGGYEQSPLKWSLMNHITLSK